MKSKDLSLLFFVYNQDSNWYSGDEILKIHDVFSGLEEGEYSHDHAETAFEQLMGITRSIVEPGYGAPSDNIPVQISITQVSE